MSGFSDAPVRAWILNLRRFAHGQSESYHVRRGTSETRRPPFLLIATTAMNYPEVPVVPAAFALLTTLYMFAGRTKRLAEGESHTAAVLRVAFFLLCTMFVIAATSSDK